MQRIKEERNLDTTSLQADKRTKALMQTNIKKNEDFNVNEHYRNQISKEFDQDLNEEVKKLLTNNYIVIIIM